MSRHVQNTRLGCLTQVDGLREHMLSPSRGKSHLSLLKSTSYPQGSPMGHLKEFVLKLSVLKLSCPHLAEKSISRLVTGTQLQAYEKG